MIIEISALEFVAYIGSRLIETKDINSVSYHEMYKVATKIERIDKSIRIDISQKKYTLIAGGLGYINLKSDDFNKIKSIYRLPKSSIDRLNQALNNEKD